MNDMGSDFGLGNTANVGCDYNDTTTPTFQKEGSIFVFFFVVCNLLRMFCKSVKHF